MGLFSRLFRKDKKQAEQTRITTNTIQVIVSREKAMIFDAYLKNEPHFVVIEVEGTMMLDVSQEFDYSQLVSALKTKAENNNELKEALTNIVIDLNR